MSPRYCHACGVRLPEGQPQFCIECGAAIRRPPAAPGPARPGRAAATVRLANAGVEQAVIGGTVQLPSSGAVPPGLWLSDAPPGPEDVIAIYPPLRPLAEGWSGLVGRGWQAEDAAPAGDGWLEHRFSALAEWFPAPGCGRGLRVRARLLALERARAGRERRGFRYRLGASPPIELLELAWLDARGAELRDAPPTPMVQLMAPPRVPRGADFPDDQVRELGPAEADDWAAGSLAPGLYLAPDAGPLQSQTLAGRGFLMRAAPRPGPVGQLVRALLAGLVAEEQRPRYRLRLLRPYRASLAEWRRLLPRIRREARGLGLDLTRELAAEWWLDHTGHDGLILTDLPIERYDAEHVAIVFRRAQIALVRPEPAGGR